MKEDMDIEQLFTAIYRCSCDDNCQTAINTFREFIKDGGDFDMVSDAGWSILHKAAEHGDIEIINEMAKLGANLNIKDNSNNPAIFHALDVDIDTALQNCEAITFETTIAFLKNGADFNLVNKQGRTMREFVEVYGTEVVEQFDKFVAPLMARQNS